MFTRSSLSYLFLSLLFWGFTPELTAQNDNPVISIQGTLKDANGSSVADGEQELIFRLYDVLTNGDALWTETAPVNVVGGIYSHNLGSVTPLNEGNFDRKLYLGVTVSGLELFPRTELTYAPYALSVATAQRVAQQGCSGQVGDIKYSILKPTDFAMENGDCWVPMDGRAIPLTKLAGYGMANVPDAGGLFLRSQEYSTDRDPDRTADTPIARVQEGAISSHGHTADQEGSHTHSVGEIFLNNISVQDQVGGDTGLNNHTGTIGYGTWFEYENDGSDYMRLNQGSANRTTSTPSRSHSHNIQNTGGPETRPTNMNFYLYIRVD